MIDTNTAQLGLESQDKLKESIISWFTNHSNFTTLDLSKEFNSDHQVIVGVCKALEMNEIITLEKREEKLIELTSDGLDCLKKGSFEIQLVKELKTNGNQTKKEIASKLGQNTCERGFNSAMKAKMIQYDKASDMLILKISDIPADTVSEQLIKFTQCNEPGKYEDKLLQNYAKNMKLITVETRKIFSLEKGKNFNVGIQKFETDLTAELLNGDKWEKTKFKKYNYNTLGKEVDNGALHMLLIVRAQIRQIFLETGFEEMPTNNFVESSFWNFDSLFQPQQHPSRDAHDTFFIKVPKYAKTGMMFPDYFKRVKEVHEIGGYGSMGWQYKWSEEEASKNILRTHTTAVSSRMLYKLAEEYKRTGTFTPKKYFSIDRVFRNESLDNTHLAEFHQIEGLIADYNLGLGHLIGTIEDFFIRFGIKKLRFKPAYNPYTEPSMEIFAYHEVSKKWVEIGNSGIFRPEMLMPMGLPASVSVIAWGLSLERPTMIHYRLENIRDLFGHEVKVDHTREAPMYVLK